VSSAVPVLITALVCLKIDAVPVVGLQVQRLVARTVIYAVVVTGLVSALAGIILRSVGRISVAWLPISVVTVIALVPVRVIVVVVMSPVIVVAPAVVAILPIHSATVSVLVSALVGLKVHAAPIVGLEIESLILIAVVDPIVVPGLVLLESDGQVPPNVCSSGVAADDVSGAGTGPQRNIELFPTAA